MRVRMELQLSRSAPRSGVPFGGRLDRGLLPSRFTAGPTANLPSTCRPMPFPKGAGLTEDAILMLEDGRTFPGEAYGARGTAFGEVVFNTSMTGYQEVLTD